ncbi:ABC transporter substrate-binding protein [Ornithinimicrobium pratense]|uniref:ABC transporter substrate-binding protein n=1 Tax=Ornithinimicrobium pratense TaxID=2593973 RepID=UPI0017880FB6|nr:ABC transporter substrate-binding protein [Ornithinimicrobium pratense]
MSEHPSRARRARPLPDSLGASVITPSRRSLGAAAFMVTAATITGCSAPGDGGSTAGPAEGGTLTYALDTPLNSLDPNLAGAAQEGRVLRQVVDSLVSLDADGAVQPWLAEEWEVSDDGEQYVFTLRDDVMFSDDTPLNAEAVCFNFDRIADPANGSLGAKPMLGPYAGCEATEEFTATISLTEPFVPFLNYASSTFLGIASPAAVETMGAAEFAQAPVGSGPFVVESYTPNDRVTMVRNEDYQWGPATAAHQGPAYLDKLVFQIIPDATVRIGSLRAGEVDMIGVVPETEFTAVDADTTLDLLSEPQPGTTAQLFLNQSQPGLDDVNVRKAIRAAVDWETAVQSLYFGAYDYAWGLLTPVTPGYSDSAEGAYEYDPELAAELLEEAGWIEGADGIREKNGERLVLRYIESDPSVQKKQDYGSFIAANLADVGIEVDLAFQANAPLQADRQNSNYALATLSYSNADPNVLANTLLSSNIPTPEQATFNLSHIEDSELDALLAEGRTETDADARAAIYEEVQDIVIENAYTIGMYVPVYTIASKAGITGLSFSIGYPMLYDVQLPSS